MLKQIFIVGWGGSGTRVVSHILKEVGYNIGKDLNIANDYMPILNNKYDPTSINEKEPWAIKHGQIMCMIPEFRKVWPKAKFILVRRNPIDNILNLFDWEKTFGKQYVKSKDKLTARAEAYKGVHEKAYKDGIDYTVTLEGLVDNMWHEVKGLLDFVEVDDNPNRFDCYIKRPKTIGRRFEELEEEDINRLENICK